MTLHGQTALTLSAETYRSTCVSMNSALVDSVAVMKCTNTEKFFNSLIAAQAYSQAIINTVLLISAAIY